MGEVATMERGRPALPTAFDLTPRTLDEAIRLAELISKSELVPPAYQDKPANVMIAVQMGQEVGLKPLAALQNIAVINGKPGLYGDAGKALLLGRGFGIEEMDAEAIKKGGLARCTITRPGHAPVTRTFSIEDAKTAGLWGKVGPWTEYPSRQLAWRAFWFAARDAAADVLKGLGGGEELEDQPREARNITPQPTDDADLMPKRASEAGKAPEGKAPDGPPKLTFTIGSSNYETNGFSMEQMKRSFKLAKEVDDKFGKNTAAKILRDEFAPAESRNDLTEEQGDAYLKRLDEKLSEGKE